MGNQIYHRGHREHGGKTNTLHHEGHEVNEVKQVSPMATNASPLDHARRAAGGKLQVKTVPPDFGQCEGLGVDSRKQTEAV